MAEKDTKAQAPEEGAVFVHLDDFLDSKHEEIKSSTGMVHVESLTAFAKAQKADGTLKRTQEDWNKAYQTFFKSTPK